MLVTHRRFNFLCTIGLFFLLSINTACTGANVELSFIVDMNLVGAKAKNTDLLVGVKGEGGSLQWSQSLTLSEKDKDGVYIGSVNFKTDDKLQFKFVFLWRFSMGRWR